MCDPTKPAPPVIRMRLFFSCVFLLDLVSFPPTQEAGGHACHDCERGHVPSHHGAGADYTPALTHHFCYPARPVAS